jgi:hypothetical protein
MSQCNAHPAHLHEEEHVQVGLKEIESSAPHVYKIGLTSETSGHRFHPFCLRFLQL